MSDEYRVDLHVKVLDERVVSRAKRVGLDALVYAPHFTPLPEIEATAERYADDELAIIPGREIFTGSWGDRQHVLALDLDEPIPDYISLAGAMDECTRQDAIVLVPHPTFATVSLGEAEIRAYRDVIDAIEVFNPKHLPIHNRRAQRLATEIPMPSFTSSYAHLRRTIGAAATVFDGVASTADLFEALRSGAPRTVDHNSGRAMVGTTAIELAHLGWENTWEKFERVVLSGTEPTHPTNSRYERRFDDVSVY
ncbi:PHP-associated domain-containing protein [Halovivax gelatinilyticus]|uniref:PHP-associated domain-containing protein n=1 Tax=Halovivax gelatinilyticus TaxID=2961597 RepID=UPI0020CA5423|nr:PHP-associated domain-containing protein [Halovivax gelatinilyticus]